MAHSYPFLVVMLLSHVILATLCGKSQGFSMDSTSTESTRIASPSRSVFVGSRKHQFSRALNMVSLDLGISDSSKMSIETRKIQLSRVQAEVKICTPEKGAATNFDPFAYITNLFEKEENDPKSISYPPLLFIHGSFHASWCWSEHYMPFFASLGYPCYALSLRGTGGTFAGEGVSKVKIDDHIDDLTDFISYIRESEGTDAKPVLIAHSFGGLAIMKYLEKNLLKKASGATEKDLAVGGVASLCSVPPSGNGKMTMRFLKRSLVDSWKITAGLAMKKCITDEKLCRELFFDVNDQTMSEGDVRRYQASFKSDSVATIDLADLAKKLPSKHLDGTGRAVFLPKQLPSIVIGAEDDFIVDEEGVLETGRYYGVAPVIVDSSHDIMLGEKWENGAKALQRWLEEEL
jgi:pimeloyl-ACP methyl ester carboxylesterase